MNALIPQYNEIATHINVDVYRHSYTYSYKTVCIFAEIEDLNWDPLVVAWGLGN